MIPAMMVAFLLICNTMTMATNPWNENDKEVPWFGEILPPEPFIGFYTKVAQCLWNVKPVCGLQIYTHIFHRSKKLDDNCCRNVVKVGVRCSRRDVPNPGCPLTTRQPAENLYISYHETHT